VTRAKRLCNIFKLGSRDQTGWGPMV